MYRVLLLVALAAFTLIGCSESETSQNSAQNSTQERYETPKPEGYGNNPVLDQLYDECEGGDTVACEDLYLESPVGSRYEAFAVEQGGAESIEGTLDQGTTPNPGTETPAGPEVKTTELGESVSFTPAETNGQMPAVTVKLQSVEVYEELERDPEYDFEGMEPGPFAVATFEFTNDSEDEYLSADDAFGFSLQTSTTTQQTTGSLSTFKIQPQETNSSKDAAPDTTRKVVVIFDMEPDGEPRTFVFEESEYYEPVLEVSLD